MKTLGEDRDTRRRSHRKTEAETGVMMWPQAQGAWGHQKLGEAGRTLPWPPESTALPTP